MKIENDIKINQFGQNLTTITEIINYFNRLDENEKKDFLTKLIYFTLQLKPDINFVDDAIKLSGLKETYTSSVLLKKGVDYNNLNKIISLPQNEFYKSLSLILSLYYLAYQKEYTANGYNPNKWWYNDLSDITYINKIKALNDFNVTVKRLYSESRIETGCILSTLIPINITIYEKNLIEKRLELYAFNQLYPNTGINIFKSIYNDTASLVIIKNINELSNEDIKLAIY